MNRFVFGLLCAAAMLAVPSVRALDIVTGGRARAAVLVDPQATASAEKAAEEFIAYVEQMTGQKLARIDRPDTAWRTIRIGAPGKFTRSDEIVVFVNRRGELEITGEGTRGPVYAVYKFLETFGVRYWSPWRETVPELKSITVPNSFKLNQVPAFESRNGWSVSDCGYDKSIGVWKMKMGQNAHVPKGFGTPHVVNISETMTRKYLKADKYFAEHPEWYALVGGERKPTQICQSNPEAIEALIAEVRAELVANSNCTSISLASDDNDKFCRCDGCRKILAQDDCGDTALELHVANQVARAIARDYPRAKVSILAYWTKERPPRKMKIEPNVEVGMALGRNYAFPVTQSRDWMEKADGWARAADSRIYIWDYYANFRNFHEPRPDAINIVPNVRHYHSRGFLGASAQLSIGTFSLFGEMKAYLWSQAIWNPQVDADKIFDEFITANYGKGAGQVRQYWDLMVDALKKAEAPSMGNYGSNYEQWFTPEMMFTSWNLVNEALRLTEGDPLANRQCEYLLVAVINDFVLRWDKAEIGKRLKDAELAVPIVSRPALVRQLDEICRKYRYPSYWSEQIGWDIRMNDWREKYKEE
ncbi:MAG: DUF4838 domain-containing protein [Lentisphaerae bacterium]|jgi:hypothetical protein|nr:DUF4838 domain-containing protein [Lentisphaerota bacterium]